MIVSYVVAMTRKGVMGKNNALPWHLPEDLKHFKAVTLGKPVLMGRKTYESIGRPLPGRKNIVLSRNAELKIPGVECVTKVEEALALVKDFPELCVIGGGEIFKLFENHVNKLHVTWIDENIEGDIYFPLDFSWKNFRELSKTEHFSSNIHYSFTEWEKLLGSSESLAEPSPESLSVST